MEFRAIRPQEFAQAANIMAQAFHSENYQPPENSSGEAHRCLFGAFDDEGRMTSAVSAPAMNVNYFGRYVPMCAVGGVSSLPETRREGHMRGLLTCMLTLCAARGDKLAALYPFSHVFYRKFGFECCSRRYFCTIPMEQLSAFPASGRARQFFPGMDAAPIREIYRVFCENRNLTCDRENRWDRYLGDDPYKTRRYLYVWENDAGEKQGYISFAPDGSGDAYSVLQCAYVCPGALRGILGFMKCLAPQRGALKWLLPAGVDPFLLFPEPYTVKTELRPGGMARIMDVKWCLENRPWPREKGEITLEVTDDILPDNTGVFTVRFENGRADVGKISSSVGPADLRLSIQALTLLCLGTDCLDALTETRMDIEIGGQEALLRGCFRRRLIQLTEEF